MTLEQFPMPFFVLDMHVPFNLREISDWTFCMINYSSSRREYGQCCRQGVKTSTFNQLSFIGIVVWMCLELWGKDPINYKWHHCSIKGTQIKGLIGRTIDGGPGFRVQASLKSTPLHYNKVMVKRSYVKEIAKFLKRSKFTFTLRLCR